MNVSWVDHHGQRNYWTKPPMEVSQTIFIRSKIVLFDWLDDSDEELFRRTGNYLTKSTILRSGTIDCLRCADFKHDVAHSVGFNAFHQCNLSFSSSRNFYDRWNFTQQLEYFLQLVEVNIWTYFKWMERKMNVFNRCSSNDIRLIPLDLVEMEIKWLSQVIEIFSKFTIWSKRRLCKFPWWEVCSDHLFRKKKLQFIPLIIRFWRTFGKVWIKSRWFIDCFHQS